MQIRFGAIYKVTPETRREIENRALEIMRVGNETSLPASDIPPHLQGEERDKFVALNNDFILHDAVSEVLKAKTGDTAFDGIEFKVCPNEGQAPSMVVTDTGVEHINSAGRKLREKQKHGLTQEAAISQYLAENAEQVQEV